MTILEAIALTDELKPNVYSREVKIGWLSKLEGMVYRNILRTHRGKRLSFSGYGPETDLNTVLLAPPPFDTIYLRWLEAQIDLAGGEFDRYNSAITVFTDEYQAFENDYHRNHRPWQGGRRFRF